jgi:hypothetical protein
VANAVGACEEGTERDLRTLDELAVECGAAWAGTTCGSDVSSNDTLPPRSA